SGSVPLGLTTIKIGRRPDNNASQWNGHIARLVYWNTRQPDEFLQAITA
ncbi:hypothetical protein LCGC14_1619900, partial [marine sediment metagenome]